MEDNNAIFTKVGSTNARIIRYDELRLDYTIPAHTTAGILKPDTLELEFFNAYIGRTKKNDQWQFSNSEDYPKTGTICIRGKITEIDMPGITNWITDAYGYKNSIRIRAPYLTKFSLPNNPKTVKLNLADLLLFNNLQYLDLSGDTAVTGNIGELSWLLDSLNTILLNNTGITGNIESLSFMYKLSKLELSATSVTGDISQLGGLYLEYLDLSRTLVDGDISKLKWKGLTHLDLSYTKVSGAIPSFLYRLPYLTSLELGHTKVTGDVQVCIEKMPNLKFLSIPETVTITDEQKRALTDRGCEVYIS